MTRTDPDEWEHKGYVIQKHIHPRLSKYSVFQKETKMHIDRASTLKGAKQVIQININKINMSRFVISAPFGYAAPTYHKTIEEVVNQLKSKDYDTSLNTYYIDCLIDDIQITADELLQVWEEGERPQDLQFF